MKPVFSARRLQRRDGAAGRQCAAVLLLALGLAACGGPQVPPGQVGSVAGFLGGSASDEPRAALTARDVLSAGGSAVDAAVAGFFTLAVAYPAGAGLGGGGVCIVYDTRSNKAEGLEFLPGPPKTGGDFAVPGAVRAMAALHGRYGRLPWTQLVAPAESLARFGHPMSRALASRIPAAADRLYADPLSAGLFLRPDGTPRAEGELLVQADLAATLAAIRQRGGGEMYTGPVARAFAEAVERQGGTVSRDDMRDYLPRWQAPTERAYGNQVALTLAPPDGGRVLDRLLMALRSAGPRADAATHERLTAEAYASARATVEAGIGGGDAALVVGDRAGNAAACVFTMSDEFGTGRTASPTGVLLAPAAARADLALAPLLLVNRPTRQAFFVGAASGAAAAPAALATVAAAVHDGGVALADALAAPRGIRLGPNGPLLSEAADPAAAQATGRVQALWCPGGFDDAPAACRFGSDPRGHGMAAGQGITVGGGM